MSKNKRNPIRYVVHHEHEWRGMKEWAWASYNCALSNSLSLAIHTASRYKGEIFCDFGDGILEPFKSYIKPAKV